MARAANDVRCELIEQDRLKELEPHAAGIGDPCAGGGIVITA
jgi:hypothetical protein